MLNSYQVGYDTDPDLRTIITTYRTCLCNTGTVVYVLFGHYKKMFKDYILHFKYRISRILAAIML